MTTCIIAHSTVPSTMISRELALTIGASPSPLTFILNNKRQEVCDKKKCEEENLPASLLFSHFPNSISSDCLVSLWLSLWRVRAYLSTNQQKCVVAYQEPVVRSILVP